MSPSRFASVVAGVVLFIFAVIFSFNLFEGLDADQIMVVQSPFSGSLTWYTTAGIKWQGFGKYTKYQKRANYWFSAKDDQGTDLNQAIKVRFNDGGHGTISGSIAWEMPTSDSLLTMIHTKYGSYRAVEQELVRTVVEKAVYMTGPVMSSKESYAERRNDLIHFIDDQIANGVYKTETKESDEIDELSGSKRTVKIVSLVKERNGELARQDVSPLSLFGIRVFNLSINGVEYDDRVESQIQAQQQATMNVQTARANALAAQQDAITAQKKGEAEAAKAKWEQEVEKARAVTKAQQELEVARLETQKAAQYKQKKILEAEADAEYKRKVMVADGALTQKLETYERVMSRFADNVGKQKWVPEIQFGSTDATRNNSNAANSLMEMFSTKVARDLALDLGMKKN